MKTLPMKRSYLIPLLTGILVFLNLHSCSLFGEQAGACVSTPKEFTYGLRVYCNSGWDASECSEYNELGVNGVSWSHHSGQTCQDRNLEEGSNPWP